MTAAGSQEKTFLASLFDFGFTSFVTLRFLKVIYAIWVVLILIGGVAMLIFGFSSGTSIGIIASIILVPLITLVYIIVARIFFEIVAMFFRIGDNTYLAVQLLGGKPSGLMGGSAQPAPAPYGSAPQNPWPGTPAAPSGGAAGPASPYAQSQPNYPPSYSQHPQQGYPQQGYPQQSYPQPGQAPDQTRRQYPDSSDDRSTPPSNQ